MHSVKKAPADLVQLLTRVNTDVDVVQRGGRGEGGQLDAVSLTRPCYLSMDGLKCLQVFLKRPH